MEDDVLAVGRETGKLCYDAVVVVGDAGTGGLRQPCYPRMHTIFLGIGGTEILHSALSHGIAAADAQRIEIALNILRYRRAVVEDGAIDLKRREIDETADLTRPRIVEEGLCAVEDDVDGFDRTVDEELAGCRGGTVHDIVDRAETGVVVGRDVALEEVDTGVAMAVHCYCFREVSDRSKDMYILVQGCQTAY